MTIDKGASNTVASWASTIREAALFDGATKVAEVSVTGETISFTGLSGANVTAADDGSKTLDLYLTFESTVTDNQQYQFRITNTNVTAGLGSSLFTTFAAQSSDVTGDADRLEVTATKLAFSTQPPVITAQNTAFSAAVEARDANNNADFDYATNIALSVATGTGTLSAVSGLSKAPVSGASSWSDLKYDTPETGVSILAQSGALASGTSNTFTVTNAASLSDIVLGSLAIPTDISSIVNTQGAEVAVFEFTVRDGGGTADADNFATIIDALTIVPGALNTISDWSAYILGAELYNGASLLGTGTVASAGISFSGAPLTSAPDNDSVSLTLKLWLKNPLPLGADDKIFQAKINQNSNVTIEPSGSLMAAGGADVVGGSGSEIAVVATELHFVGTVPNTNVNTNFPASARGTDANGNIDADFTAFVTFAKASGLGNLTGTTNVPAVLGTAATTDLKLDLGGLYTLSANSGVLTGATSNSFAVGQPSVFRVANVLTDTLWWDSTSTWVVDSGYSLAGVPHSKDQVILDHKYNATKYIVAVGPTSDSAAQITIGYVGNPDTVTLVIPGKSPLGTRSLVFGDGVAGNYDLILSEKGVIRNVKYGYSYAMNYKTTADSISIRHGGYFYWGTVGYNSVMRINSRKFDGDYGTVEFDIPNNGGFDYTASAYYYPNVVMSNTHGYPTLFSYPPGGPGAMYIMGDLTINPGTKDSMASGPIFVYGNIVNNGIQQFTTSALVFAGTTAQTVSGANPMILGNGLVILNPAGVTFLTDVNVTGGAVQTSGDYTFDPGTGTPAIATAQGVLSMGTRTMFMDPAGSMSATENANPIQGKVSATRTLSQGVNEAFGGVGVEINAAGGVPGLTTVLRKTGATMSGNGHQSILRNYAISPTTNTGLNAQFGFSYGPGELRGIPETQLILQKTTDDGTTWTGKSGTINTGLHKITATGINSFSTWTAASADSPLFVSHTITVRKISDLDGNYLTTGDQSYKKWRLTLYKDSVTSADSIGGGNPNSGIQEFKNLEAGTYIATEADSSISGWISLGKIHHGTPIAGVFSTDTIVVAGGVSDSVDFINQKTSNLAVMKFVDTDGDPYTTADQTAVKWHFTVYYGSVAPENLVVELDTAAFSLTAIKAGTYIVSEADSGAGWKRIGGSGRLVDTLFVSAATSVIDTFVNFRPNSIVVQKDIDKDGQFATNDDRELKPWHLEVRTGALDGPVIASSETGAIALNSLGDGTYYVIESDSTGWIRLGYVLNGTPTASTDQNMGFALAGGQNVTLTFVNAPPIYGNLYRSFASDSIAYDRDNKGKVGKIVKKKATMTQFSLMVIADSGWNGLHMEFGSSIDTVGFNLSTVPPSTGASIDGKFKKWDFAFAGPFMTHSDTVYVNGWAISGKVIKVSKYYFTQGGTKVGPKKYPLATFLLNQPKLPEPNRYNLIFTTYDKGGFVAPQGLMVGMDRTDSLKNYGWVIHPKYTDILKSLKDKTGTHTGIARGFDYFTNAKPILKAQKALPPAKQSNQLFANMVAAKVGIVASGLGITPIGFGELIFDDGTSNPLNGMMVREIVGMTDTLMMGWQVDSSYLKGTKTVFLRAHHFADTSVFGNVSRTLGLINAAFEGRMDTLGWTDSLKLTGVRTLISVPYMKANLDVVPAVIIAKNMGLTELPLAYTLYQNYPNPFNPTTTIQFDLPMPAMVTLHVYNILGQKVVTLMDREQLDEGTQNVTFDGANLASGVYFYRLVAEGTNEDGLLQTFMQVKKMMLIK